jgi:hypothetical protein
VIISREKIEILDFLVIFKSATVGARAETGDRPSGVVMLIC